MNIKKREFIIDSLFSFLYNKIMEDKIMEEEDYFELKNILYNDKHPCINKTYVGPLKRFFDMPIIKDIMSKPTLEINDFHFLVDTWKNTGPEGYVEILVWFLINAGVRIDLMIPLSVIESRCNHFREIYTYCRVLS